MSIFLTRIAFFFCLCFSLQAFSQDSISKTSTDSLFASAKDSLVVKEGNGFLSDLKNNDFPRLEELIRKGKTYSLLANQIRMELEDTMDTIRLSEEIPEMETTLEALDERIKTPNTQFNFRYIFALDKILVSIQEKNEELDKIAQGKLDRLQRLDSLLKTIKSDEFFLFKIRDSTLLPSYAEEIQNLKFNIHALDSALYRQELIAARFQARLSKVTITLLGLKRYLENNRTFLEKNLLKKEINYIWESYQIPSPKSIFQITLDSLKLNFLFLRRQLLSHPLLSFCALLILMGGYFGIRNVIKKIAENKEFGEIILQRTKYLRKQTLATTMLALLPLVFFMFDTASIAFLTFFIYLQVLFSSVLIFDNFQTRTAWKWIVLVFLFLFISISNLYWEIAYQERVYYVFCNLIYLLILWQIPRKFQSEDPKEIVFLKRLRAVTLAVIFLGLLANSLGRFSLAKIFSVAGTIGFIYGVCMYFFVKSAMEISYVLLENKRDNDDLTNFLDFQRLKNRINSLFLFLAGLFWAVIYLYNLAINDFVFSRLKNFLVQERSLGDSTFTFGSILLFIGLVYLSYLISNYLAYFVSIKDQKNDEQNSKKLGSSILLIRLGVLGLGFFIAITAAKIPLDKITIVLGALSVGIGFGLQTIINNLVSGVILAFERPIQIGDDIEVGNLTGKVKEVGIRASKIQAYDGSEIVVPNGDLLSKSLINWTLSDKKRRIELIIGMSYDSDMEKVNSILNKVLDRESILKYPPPRVLMQNFSDSSVDFRVLFWIDNMDNMLLIRNEVMSEIYMAFKANDIEIPYPKRDLYLKSLPTQFRSISNPEDQQKSPES
ncbi:MAG: mechanosensitive ion channel family protein [Algoriphagus aquaeductus]|uniref:mechanosensitive ion channel family protein n=1 Tax=Algoriphagus aquaeductus TaxID=475299 RepID=UPI003879ECB4